MKISVVIPALNEEDAIARVLEQVPVPALNDLGFEVEKIVVDNGSTDKTAEIARAHGAIVVSELKLGYGNAYQRGFAEATGDIITTGDADMTYPFDMLPQLVMTMQKESIDFLNTDRLTELNPEAMTTVHRVGNWGLTFATRVLFNWPFRDSQSGMWVFRREIWPTLDAQSSGMPFSQEIKIEAFLKGHRCTEVPIEYRTRMGDVKLNTFVDGALNLSHLVRKYFAVVRQDTVSIHRIVTTRRRAY